MFRFILCGFAALMVGFASGRIVLGPMPVQTSSASSALPSRSYSLPLALVPSKSADEAPSEVPSPAATPRPALKDQLVETAPSSAFDVFLDRLMAAESGGRRDAKNPRSTALGPFQFIKSTFLDVTRRHFPTEIAGLTEAEILARRRELDLSRRAAAAFCKESVANLTERGLKPTFAHLRLAYLLGPADAARIMRAKGETPVVQLLSPAVIKANPFMRSMKVTDLLAKSERDVMRDRSELTGKPLTRNASA